MPIPHTLRFLRRRLGVGGTGEHAAAIRKLDDARVTGLRSVLREEALDDDIVAGFERVVAPAVASERVGRAAFALPVLRRALLVLHVEIDPDVRILPFELRDAALQLDLLGRVEFGGEGMVSGCRLSHRHGKAGEHGEERDSHEELLHPPKPSRKIEVGGRRRDSRNNSLRLRTMRKWLFVVFAMTVGADALNGQPPAGRAVHLTLHEGTSLAAALSPDGRTIAIDLLGTLWTMPASGGVAKPITDIFMDARQPSWSPDSTRLAFQAYRSSTWQIWTIKADGSDLRAVTTGPYDDREPAWSPNGERIAFSSDRSGSYDVWVLTLATGEVKQITAGPSNEFQPSWRSGSTEIAFVSDRREAPGVYVADLGMGPMPVERLVAPADGAVAGPVIGPDGSSAFSVVAGGRSRLMIGGRNIADPDEDVFPFRPQWISQTEVLYTADGKIKRRPAARGPARVVEFTADVSFTRPAFTP